MEKLMTNGFAEMSVNEMEMVDGGSKAYNYGYELGKDVAIFVSAVWYYRFCM